MSKLTVKSDESTTIEWKQSLSEINEIIQTAAAFANTEGGRIFIGVSPKGNGGLPDPIYEEAGGSFVTIFHNPKQDESVQKVSEHKVGEKLSSN